MKQIEKMTFEEKLERLSELARSMEQDNLPLEDMLKSFDESQILIKDLKKTITDAKKKIEKYETEEEE